MPLNVPSKLLEDGMRLTARYVGDVAVDGRHPQVGGAGIKHDVKRLAWGPDGDRAVVLGLEG